MGELVIQLMEKACPICGDPAVEESRFCKVHYRAHVNLESAFRKWQIAYSNEMDRRSFLCRISKLAETGQKAREVASFLLETETP